jgi:hypothetical protein
MQPSNRHNLAIWAARGTPATAGARVWRRVPTALRSLSWRSSIPSLGKTKEIFGDYRRHGVTASDTVLSA